MGLYYSRQHSEASTLPLSRSTDKQTAGRPDAGLLLGEEKKGAVEPREDTEEPEVHTTK